MRRKGHRLPPGGSSRTLELGAHAGTGRHDRAGGDVMPAPALPMRGEPDQHQRPPQHGHRQSRHRRQTRKVPSPTHGFPVVDRDHLQSHETQPGGRSPFTAAPPQVDAPTHGQDQTHREDDDRRRRQPAFRALEHQRNDERSDDRQRVVDDPRDDADAQGRRGECAFHLGVQARSMWISMPSPSARTQPASTTTASPAGSSSRELDCDRINAVPLVEFRSVTFN